MVCWLCSLGNFKHAKYWAAFEFVEKMHTIYAQKAINEKSEKKFSFFYLFIVWKTVWKFIDGFEISNQFLYFDTRIKCGKQILFLILAILQTLKLNECAHKTAKKTKNAFIECLGIPFCTNFRLSILIRVVDPFSFFRIRIQSLMLETNTDPDPDPSRI